MADLIEIALWDDRVSITMRPEVSAWTKTRNITVESALEVASLLLRSGSLHDTMTVEGQPEVVCQVEGGTDRYAWLGISQWGYRGDPDLIACLSGETVHEIGRAIHDLCLWAKKPDQMPVERRIFVREITAFYLKGENGNQSLTDVIPAHP